ncbi:MAG: nitric oxide reductase transcriptional regulator NorR [Gammaproteobacteria bacterium]|nr:nitric oxide reductase transcriptional regulator NorR [Gammaproteobacteria bacterium]
MTSTAFCKGLTSIVEDLSRDIPARDRYKNLLTVMQDSFPCDAATLLKLDSDKLIPLAIDGLSDDAMGRRFVVDENPRLAALLHSREPVRFAADSDIPDPFDGLVDTKDGVLHVHDCMGSSLYIDEKPWGVLTLDAMLPGTFDQIDPIELRTFVSLAEATVKAAERIDELKVRVERGVRLTQELIGERSEVVMIGGSLPMQNLQNDINTVASSELTVLIQGETGVGKELVAKQIHAQSTRSEKPLIFVNCAALPENIAESELFGHVKGAFTDAKTSRTGKFEIADGGSLFLDEIGELSLGLQAKLLRALQNGEIQRIGSDKNVKVDIRIIAATNRDLQKEVTAGNFRADFYHRLAVYPIQVPPLRDRDTDILLLAGYFLEKNQHQLTVRCLRLSADVKKALQSHLWPGNVRELSHLLSRASLKAKIRHQGSDQSIIIIDNTCLDLGRLEKLWEKQSFTEHGFSAHAACNIESNRSLKEAVEQFQRNLIEDMLKQHNDNLASAGRALGINRSNFYRLLKRLDIQHN